MRRDKIRLRIRDGERRLKSQLGEERPRRKRIFFFFFSLSRRLSSTNKALGPIVAVITGKALSQPQALSANDDKSICETLLGQPYSGTSRGTGQDRQAARQARGMMRCTLHTLHTAHPPILPCLSPPQEYYDTYFLVRVLFFRTARIFLMG